MLQRATFYRLMCVCILFFVLESNVVRAYGALEFLNLSQVINYLKLLCDLEIEPRILIQLINDKKIPCYVDVNGILDFPRFYRHSTTSLRRSFSS